MIGRSATRLAVLLLLLLAALARPGHPEAHGIVIESSPKHEETVATPPKRLVLRFNSRLEKRLCSVTLIGPKQASVLLVRQDLDAAPDTLTYPLPDLKPGEYRAKWKVLAADGHVTEGVVVFKVAEPAAK